MLPMAFQSGRAQRTPATRKIRSPQDVEVAPGIFASSSETARQYYVNQAFVMNKLAASISAQQKSKARIKGLKKELKELQKLVVIPTKQTEVAAHHDSQTNTIEPHSSAGDQSKDKELRFGLTEALGKQPIVPENDQPTTESNESVERDEDESDDESEIEIIINDIFQVSGTSDTRSPYAYGMKTDNSDYTIELGQSLREEAADTISKVSVTPTIKGNSAAGESNNGPPHSDRSGNGRVVTPSSQVAPSSPSIRIPSVAETAAEEVEKPNLGLSALTAGALFVPGASSYDRWSVAADYSMKYEEPCSEIDFDLWEGPEENMPEANTTAMPTSKAIDDQPEVLKAKPILTSSALFPRLAPANMDAPNATSGTPFTPQQTKPFRGMGASRWADGSAEPRALNGPKGSGGRPQVEGVNGKWVGNSGRNQSGRYSSGFF